MAYSGPVEADPNLLPPLQASFSAQYAAPISYISVFNGRWKLANCLAVVVA